MPANTRSPQLHSRRVTGMAERDVISEIERYFVNPGQATAYKVGMHKLLELREHAQSVLGDEFDLRQFHDLVLDNGSMPLTVLERLVEDSLQGETTASLGDLVPKSAPQVTRTLQKLANPSTRQVAKRKGQSYVF